jgi:pimeloyl-ACP methyl ester carboxylesterase
LSELGYERYVVSAGDVGYDVAEALAASHPDRVLALHLTDVSQYHFLVNPPQDLSDAERAYVQHGHHWQATEGGYMHQQSTKPHTLAVGLGDSPAGLAAWILEKLRTWTDCGGDGDRVHPGRAAHVDHCILGQRRDRHLLHALRRERVETDRTNRRSSGFHDLTEGPRQRPREFAARSFDVRSWAEEPAGGHFAAWERLSEYVTGVRTAVDLTNT